MRKKAMLGSKTNCKRKFNYLLPVIWFPWKMTLLDRDLQWHRKILQLVNAKSTSYQQPSNPYQNWLIVDPKLRNLLKKNGLRQSIKLPSNICVSAIFLNNAAISKSRHLHKALEDHWQVKELEYYDNVAEYYVTRNKLVILSFHPHNIKLTHRYVNLSKC